MLSRETEKLCKLIEIRKCDFYKKEIWLESPPSRPHPKEKEKSSVNIILTLFSLGGGGAHCARTDFNEL